VGSSDWTTLRGIYKLRSSKDMAKRVKKYKNKQVERVRKHFAHIISERKIISENLDI
jgi:hypothetical protein